MKVCQIYASDPDRMPEGITYGLLLAYFTPLIEQLVDEGFRTFIVDGKSNVLQFFLERLYARKGIAIRSARDGEEPHSLMLCMDYRAHDPRVLALSAGDICDSAVALQAKIAAWAQA